MMQLVFGMFGRGPLASKDKRYFFAVGQKSFEAGTSANHFSTVVPIADTNGEIVDTGGRNSLIAAGPGGWYAERPASPCAAGLSDHVRFRGCNDLSSSPDKDVYQLLQPRFPVRRIYSKS